MQPPSLLSLLELDEDNWKEWHYSFSRNGLTDFLPQFSDHISCLVIDTTASLSNNDNQKDQIKTTLSSSSEAESTRLPWQHDDDSQATSSIMNLPISMSHHGDDGLQVDAQRNQQMMTVDSITASIANMVDGDDENAFDCILDGGVLNAVISSLPPTVTWHSRSGPPALLDLANLMKEATQTIREFGIYVAITESSIPDHAKEYLNSMGDVMGMQWKFDLDGLSNDEYVVSVVRKYYTGAVNYAPPHQSGDKNFLKP